MSGWTVRENESVKIKHHSTCSLIEMTITTDEEAEEGKWEKIKETVWLNYAQFSDLKKVINQIP